MSNSNQRVFLTDYSSRKSFTPPDHWLETTNQLEPYLDEIPKTNPDMLTGRVLKCQNILKEIPFVIPFEKRIALFHGYINHELSEFYSDDWRRPVARVKIRRGHVFEDGYTFLNGLGSNLKKRIAITFVDEHGFEEAGIDGGGVFKEFMTRYSKII